MVFGFCILFTSVPEAPLHEVYRSAKVLRFWIAKKDKGIPDMPSPSPEDGAADNSQCNRPFTLG